MPHKKTINCRRCYLIREECVHCGHQVRVFRDPCDDHVEVAENVAIKCVRAADRGTLEHGCEARERFQDLTGEEAAEWQKALKARDSSIDARKGSSMDLDLWDMPPIKEALHLHWRKTKRRIARWREQMGLEPEWRRKSRENPEPAGTSKERQPTLVSEVIPSSLYLVPARSQSDSGVVQAEQHEDATTDDDDDDEATTIEDDEDFNELPEGAEVVTRNEPLDLRDREVSDFNAPAIKVLDPQPAQSSRSIPLIDPDSWYARHKGELWWPTPRRVRQRINGRTTWSIVPTSIDDMNQDIPPVPEIPPQFREQGPARPG